MNRWTLALLLISVLSTVIAIFLYIGAARERDYFMAVNSKYWKELQFLKYPVNSESMPVMGARQQLEGQIETLNAQIAEGFKIINDQKAVINNLRTLLAQSQARNKQQKGRK